MEYAGFWRRFGAFWIDFVVLLPLMAMSYFFMNRYRLFQLYWFLPGTLFGLWFSVYLVKRYGGTPGKLLLKMRIAMLDGSPITFKAAALRHSVLFTLSIATSVAMAMACLQITDTQYLPLGYLDKSMALVKVAPAWYKTIEMLMQVWIWSEFISMLFNKKRRAIHDFIASTVVIKTTAQQSN
jgi:uncharacterized RDD family membrane protein YckC